VQKSFCITVVPTMANYKLPQKYAKKPFPKTMIITAILYLNYY
jgi:hypothetical protein